MDHEFVAIRKPQDWKPQGKSAAALIYSLGNHLFSKYGLPRFFFNVFEELGIRRQFNDMMLDFLLHVGKGESPAAFAKKNKFFKFTHRMYHILMGAPEPDGSIIANIRKAQVLGAGGSTQLWKHLKTCGYALDTSLDNEEFYSSMVVWLVNQKMMDYSLVPTFYDYIMNCRRENSNWTLKGRNAVSLLKDVEKWHKELGMLRSAGGASFPTPNFALVRDYDFSKGDEKEIWRFRPIVDSKQLANEGRRQGHCVLSYAQSIIQGHTYIWTLTLENNDGNWAMLTIQLNHDSFGPGTVVQARGRFNRMATQKERELLNRWRTDTGVSLHF
jgi:hypothetical protein